MKANYPLPLLLSTLLAACGGGGGSPGTATPGGIEPPPPATGISLLAGDVGGYGNIDGIGDQARLNGPAGLAFDAKGNLYIADRLNNALLKMTPQGEVSTLATGFNSPDSVVADSAGNLYVLDAGNLQIRKVTPTGQVSVFATLFPSPVGDGSRPLAQLAIDSAGMLYATDPRNKAIMRISADGSVIALFNTLDTPSGIAVDQDGTIYYGDGYALRRRPIAGLTTTIAGKVDAQGYVDGASGEARFGRISAMSIAANGDLLVADQGSSRVRKVSANGVVSTVAGRGQASVSHPERDLLAPGGLALAADGKIFVSDGGNHVIRTAKPDGSVATVAGLALTGWSYEAADPGRKFYSLSGIAADKAGNSYLADYNGTLFKFNPQGTLGKVETTGFSGFIDHLTSLDDGTLYFGGGDTIYRVANGKAEALNPFPLPAGAVATLRLSGLAQDGKGGLFAVSRNGMHQVSANGAVAHLFSTTLVPEGGLAVDASGNFYVSGDCLDGPLEGLDSHAQPSRINCSVFKISANGKATTLLDGRTSAIKLRQPVRLALDPATGNLYAASRFTTSVFSPPTEAPQIHKITPQGQASTVAGSAKLRGFKAGALPGSLPDYVTGMAVQGNTLYISTPAAALKIVGLP